MADIDVDEAGREVYISFIVIVVEVDAFGPFNGDGGDAFLLAPGEEGVVEIVLYDVPGLGFSAR
jgi:hypothetical protein